MGSPEDNLSLKWTSLPWSSPHLPGPARVKTSSQQKNHNLQTWGWGKGLVPRGEETDGLQAGSGLFDLPWRAHESSFSGQPQGSFFPNHVRGPPKAGGVPGLGANVPPAGFTSQPGFRWPDVPVSTFKGRAATRHTSQPQVPKNWPHSHPEAPCPTT